MHCVDNHLGSMSNKNVERSINKSRVHLFETLPTTRVLD